MEKTSKLNETARMARAMLVSSILGLVRENGNQCPAYETEEFGLDGVCMNGARVTRVLNFRDNGGCFFYEPSKINDRTCDGASLEDLYDRLYEGATFTAYQCLFILETADGSEELWYHCLTNGGVSLDDDQYLSGWGRVGDLELLDLHYLVKAIQKMF